MANEKALIEYVLEYSNHFPVYPLAKGTVVPLKGSKGFHGATQDPEPLVKYFTENEPESNVAASFIGTDYFVVDVDRKTPEKDGMVSLNSIKPPGADLGDPVIVKTKSGKGLHLYYRTSKEIKHKVDWLPNVDILKNSCILPPSKAPTKTGEIGEYQFIKGTLNDITEPPEWLLNAILKSQNKEDGSLVINYEEIPKKKFTAKFMEDLLEGVSEGNRDVWLTSHFGRMLSLGFDYYAAYEWLRIINSNFVSPPVSDKQLNKIVLSIVNKEQKKIARMKGSE